MANEILVIGGPGTGKSASLENLDPKVTALINCVGKPLPFKGSMLKYTKFNKEKNPAGNMWETTSIETIIPVLEAIDAKFPHIKNVVIDDSQYIMAYEFMRRAKETGFTKFTEIAQHMFSVINTGKNMRQDVNFIMLNHVEETIDNGIKSAKIKTIGKLLDEKISLEGLFTIVLYTNIERDKDGSFKYQFLTNNDGYNTAKSPKGMFDMKIPNDLQYVITKMHEYYNS